MDNNNNQKIVALSFVAVAAITGFAVATIMSAMAAAWGGFHRVYDLDLVKHGLPVAAGILLFVYMFFNKGVHAWGVDVVTEVGKIIWPARKDVTSLTIFVTIIILISGFAFGLIDYLSTHLVNFVLNLGI